MSDINVVIDSFIDRLKRKQVVGSYQAALETLQILMRYVSAIRWTSTDDLITQIKKFGNSLEKAHPYEYTCGNVVRRVLSMIRDEIEEEQNTAEPMISSMFNLLQKPMTDAKVKKTQDTRVDVRQTIVQSIRDLIDEIKNIDDGIQQIAIELIHDKEILLTPTPDSKTVLRFLLKARDRHSRNFTVLVTEGFPNNTAVAHEFAKKLSEHDIETIVIPDSAVFALMPRVGKVILGAKTVFTNGGTISSTAGVSSVCECAREFKTPVFAVAGLYKLSPLYPFDVEKMVEIGGSQHVLPTTENDRVGTVALETINPIADYIPPENIDIFITNIGGFAPSFIYRVVWDNYKQEDVNLEEKI
ncbi:Translation initiation factor eIF-2B subunit beta [Kluyveromyces marxianus]|nr:GCD complex subunit gcd7 [Kluyveromyces marxianus]KAG0674614.1 GCD complex subunit gcd7 [Kluyveromyces marxianus]